MLERRCSACRVESSVTLVGFRKLKTTYFICPLCRASWAVEAMALGQTLENQAQVYVAFTRWLDTRRVAA